MIQYQEVNGEKERRVLNIKITTDHYGQYGQKLSSKIINASAFFL